jgi:hypothetical protein
VLTSTNIHYEVDGRYRGIANGGIGIVHKLAEKAGLDNEINSRLELFKRHLPYYSIFKFFPRLTFPI